MTHLHLPNRCSGGLTSLLGRAAGFERIFSLDHDPEYIQMLSKLVAWAKLDGAIVPLEFSFGSALPAQADVVFCSALIHWVFCRTASFHNSFAAIFEYLFAAQLV